jgi:hypothetical protein
MSNPSLDELQRLLQLGRGWQDNVGVMVIEQELKEKPKIGQ